MVLHPAFWQTGVREDGTVTGLWNGAETALAPAPAPTTDATAAPAPAPDTGPAAREVPEEPPGVIEAGVLRESLVLAGRNVDHVLRRELTAVAPAGRQALTELAHLMAGLPRHAALAASDAAERPLAEALTKLSIHWTRTSEPWLALVRHLTGMPSDHLQPLPTTLALQLALEELACRDTLAYTAVAVRLGVPGDSAQARELLRLATAMLPPDDTEAPALLEDWARRTASQEDNYASVKSLRAMGSLRDTDLLTLAVDTETPPAPRRWRRSMGAVRDIGDTVSLFAFGVDHFFTHGAEPWPRTRMQWAGV
ncbi:hypothetical protein ACH4FX_32265 [Streptomyces sp. NPDC018019]|uniref:hypothetical protein n=1 Tax=Streptomyces sp. NPDC018019 TaxID=3365030 RepID=UPI0037AE0FA4